MLTSFAEQAASISSFNSQIEQLGTLLQRREAEYGHIIEQRLQHAINIKKSQPGFRANAYEETEHSFHSDAALKR